MYPAFSRRLGQATRSTISPRLWNKERSYNCTFSSVRSYECGRYEYDKSLGECKIGGFAGNATIEVSVVFDSRKIEVEGQVILQSFSQPSVTPGGVDD